MFVPSWAMRIAPYVGGALLLFGFYLWAYDKGRDSERGKWQIEESKAVAEAQAEAAAMQVQVDMAGAALSEKQAEIDMLSKAITAKSRAYYAQNPAANVPCLGPDRVRAISESDAAAFAFTPASK